MLIRYFGSKMSRILAFWGKVVTPLALVVLTCVHVAPAQAATHQVAPGTSKVDCRSYGGGIRPGDTVILTGRSRGPVTFSDCAGSASNPITIRNDTSLAGPLVIDQAGDGFKTQCDNCEHVIIDGTGKWAGAPAGVCGANLEEGDWRLGTNQCGIILRCVSGSPQSTLRVSGSSKHVTVKGVEIDGNTPVCGRGIGLSVNDHKYQPRVGEWREGFLLRNNYIHNTGRSGIYFGPNQTKFSEGDMQVRSNEISYNYVDWTGCDGIKYKSVLEGSSRIHHNYVKNTGQSYGESEDGCGSSGISLYEGGYTEIFNNYVEAPSTNAAGLGNCIKQSTAHLSSNQVSTLPVTIYNNVVRNCKGKGIAASRKGASNPKLVPQIYNNTVVAPIGESGISVNSQVESCTVRDNVIAGAKLNATNCSLARNVIASIDVLKFRDAQDYDFSLLAGSPAIDGGGGQCPRDDHVGNERPQGGACDQGAFEFVTGQASVPKPRPPAVLAVE